MNFSYHTGEGDGSDFAGGKREQVLSDIDFALKKGESLGIIGPTGCGKTTIINLLMRFYDVEDGGVFVDGRDVRTYEKKELRGKFGVVFQNDMVFQDTLRQNIDFGRIIPENKVLGAVEDAMAAEYISTLDDGLDYEATIKGANLSGGQKQRLLVARALAGTPEILILDDSSSALDYKTDAAMRRAIESHHGDSTLIMIAQRVSSVMGMTNILVMDNGQCIGYGSHQHLLETCPAYREIYDVQMGAIG
ncbi:MAG: ABC transporter ATP-binding protein [Clostridiales bacterium]|nr:ABC transporter ATP-binding protein [Clostridiales bacterium]